MITTKINNDNKLNGVQFGLTSYEWLILNYKYDFKPKLHDTNFNLDFIISILKS